MSPDWTARPDGGAESDDVEKNRYLLFQIGGELYGTPLVSVREVIKVGDIKPLPYMLPHFRGMTNLRGQVIGVVDLRLRFQVTVPGDTPGLILIVEGVHGVIGAVIDDVIAVATFPDEAIMQNDRLHTRVPLDFFKGIAKHGERLVSVIDLAGCMSAEDYTTARNERLAI